MKYYTNNRILVNKIQCKRCGDIVESKRAHDMVWCRCGQCAADGGRSCLKRGYRTNRPDEAFTELSEFEKENKVVKGGDETI